MLAKILHAERREAYRYRLQLPVLLTWTDDRQICIQAGFTRDISVTGLFVSCSPAPALGTMVHVEVLLPSLGQMLEKTIKARGPVIRAFDVGHSRGIAIAANLCAEFTFEEDSATLSLL